MPPRPFDRAATLTKSSGYCRRARHVGGTGSDTDRSESIGAKLESNGAKYESDGAQLSSRNVCQVIAFACPSHHSPVLRAMGHVAIITPSHVPKIRFSSVEMTPCRRFTTPQPTPLFQISQLLLATSTNSTLRERTLCSRRLGKAAMGRCPQRSRGSGSRWDLLRPGKRVHRAEGNKIEPE